jgi:hypothetical protein
VTIEPGHQRSLSVRDTGICTDSDSWYVRRTLRALAAQHLNQRVSVLVGHADIRQDKIERAIGSRSDRLRRRRCQRHSGARGLECGTHEISGIRHVVNHQYAGPLQRT